MAKPTVYVVDLSPAKMGPFGEGVVRATEQLGVDADALPPLTGIGVTSLAAPALLVEVDATAVID